MAKKPRRWLRRSGWAFGSFIGVVGGLSLWIVLFFPNKIVQNEAAKRAEKYGFYLRIGSLDIDPLGANIVATDIELDAMTNHDAGLPSLLTVKRYSSRAVLKEALKQERLHVESIEVDGTHIHVEQRDEVLNVDRFTTALDELAVKLGATPAPSPTPAPTDIQERVAAERDAIAEAFSAMPMPVQIDQARATNAGFTVVEEGHTLMAVSGFGASASADISADGSGGLRATLEPDDRIHFVLDVPDLWVKGELVPEAELDAQLWTGGQFRSKLRLENTTVKTGEIRESTRGVASASGHFDAVKGDLAVESFALSAGDYLRASGALSLQSFGTQSLAASYRMALMAEHVPAFATTYLNTMLEADRLTLGAEVEGSLTGKLTSANPDQLMAAIENKQLPLTGQLRAEGRSAEHVVTMSGATVGGIAFQATVDLAPERVTTSTRIQIAHLAHEMLGPRPVAAELAGTLTVEQLEDVYAKNLSASVPAKKLEVGGGGHIKGFTSALLAYLEASDQGLDTQIAALRALEATRDISLAGNAFFSAPEPLEVAPDVTLQGNVYASGELKRHGKPETVLTAAIAFDDFSAVIDESIKDIELEGLTGQLEVAKHLVIGGAAKVVANEADIVTEVEEAIEEFDPAERGYYGRLAPYRINRENVKIERIRYENYVVTDLVGDLAYDGEALRASYFRMNLLGGETVGRAYVRPSGEGIRLAFFADFAGVDVAPILREKPPENAGDASRVNGSLAASLFVPIEDPVSGIAQANARVDLSAAGSEVVNEILLFMDPEQVDPVYNWARDITRRVKGLGRPQINIISSRGYYDINIGFPALGIAKDVKRIPLGQTLALKYSKTLLDEYLPDPEILQLAGVVGIDEKGQWVFLEE